MIDEDGLFPMTETEVRELKRFDRVNVRCAWGDEPGEVVSISCEDGWPMVNVRLVRFPARVSVSPAQVRPLPDMEAHDG